MRLFDLCPLKRCEMCNEMFASIGPERMCENCEATLGLVKLLARLAADDADSRGK